MRAVARYGAGKDRPGVGSRGFPQQQRPRWRLCGGAGSARPGGARPSPHPYGGLGGEAVVERYEQLGCEPDDEFPAILAWFGLPADTPRDLEAGPLAAAVRDRIEHDETEGAAGSAALGLARRLAEGAETGDSPLFVALRDVADAQEAYQADHGRYADSLEALVAYGVDDALTDSGHTAVMIAVTAADEDAYCIHGAHQGSAVLESHDGIPHNRLPGSPSCPHTFPDIDG